VTLPSGKRLYNHATTSVGYASSSEPIVRFGMGDEKEAASVEIAWPSGVVQKLGSVKADRLVAVTEGK
jgi:enediyne biosynthesis protein E4